MIAIDTVFISGLLLLIVGLLVYLVYSRQQSKPTEISPKLDRMEEIIGIDVFSPIRDLSFQEALNLEEFKGSMEKNALEHIRRCIDDVFLPGYAKTPDTISSIRKLKSGNIEWTFTDPTKKLIREGRAEVVIHGKSGRILPTARGTENKRFIEQIKSSGPGKLAKAAKVANVVVNTAHIISGADMVKKLKAIDKKIDFLTAARKIDQYSRLESNYNLAREILSSPMTRLHEVDIRLLHKENMELRSAWRQEILHLLSDIENPENRSRIKKLFSRTKTVDKRIGGEICRIQTELRLIKFSIAYDIALTDSIGESRIFLSTSMKSEIEQLSRIKKLLREKKQYISQVSENPEVDFIEKYMQSLITDSRRFLRGIAEDLPPELE